MIQHEMLKRLGVLELATQSFNTIRLQKNRDCSNG
jgi:hypothetical protein